MERLNAVNEYVCSICKNVVVTVNAADGTTPFTIPCPDAGCAGLGLSSFYQVSQRQVPEFEWYKPDAAELEKAGGWTRDHVARGGLLMRELDRAGREAWAKKLGAEPQGRVL